MWCFSARHDGRPSQSKNCVISALTRGSCSGSPICLLLVGLFPAHPGHVTALHAENHFSSSSVRRKAPRMLSSLLQYRGISRPSGVLLLSGSQSERERMRMRMMRLHPASNKNNQTPRPFRRTMAAAIERGGSILMRGGALNGPK
jgi:hypothetical protein